MISTQALTRRGAVRISRIAPVWVLVVEAELPARDVCLMFPNAMDRQMGRDAALSRASRVTRVRGNNEAVARLERHDVIIEGPRLGPRELDDEDVA